MATLLRVETTLEVGGVILNRIWQFGVSHLTMLTIIGLYRTLQYLSWLRNKKYPPILVLSSLCPLNVYGIFTSNHFYLLIFFSYIKIRDSVTLKCTWFVVDRWWSSMTPFYLTPPLKVSIIFFLIFRFAERTQTHHPFIPSPCQW